LPRSLIQVVLVTVFAAVLTGCATGSSSLRTATIEGPDTSPAATAHAVADPNFGPRPAPVASASSIESLVFEREDASVVVAATADDEPTLLLIAADYRLDAEPSSQVLVAQAMAQSASAAEATEDEYDPWEPFNEKMFEFNRRLDRYFLKPVAKAYDTVVPDRVQTMIANGFDNIQFVPRMMNSLFQGKFDGAVREFGRFVFNSTIGIGGLFDVAKIEGIEKSREDFGQTLGFYGAPPGPYLILPLLEPLTVRDGIGKGIDGLMDPMSYFVPFIWTRLILKVEETVNDRALNLELFQGFEESVIDMYSAVRHGYLKRREKLIKE
jgi:phospholipid-binding lipoprotein MlaA